jgi:hypothetical protein
MFGFDFIFAQMVFDAKRLSMAGSNIAITEGNEYFGANPATLAQIRDFNFELHLVSAHFMVNNNSYSLKEYDKYFTNGDSLTSKDIEDLLSTMPEKGLKGNFNLGAKALSFYARPFSISLGGIGNGFLNIPKDVFNFPFLGNTVVREHSFDNLEGEAWSAALVEFAIGFPITQWTPSQFDFASVGLSARYLVGIEYANIENASGSIFTTDDYLLANAHAETRRSSGGSGYGIDLGILGVYEENWTFSLHFNNILGSMYWNKGNELSIVDFRSDSLLRLEDLEELAVVDEDTTFPIGDFRTGLSRAVTLAAAYQFQPNLVLTAAFRQGLNKSLGNTTDPHFSLGAEYTPVHFLPLRGGFAIGGESNFTLGLGLGVDLKYWQLNLAYLNHNFRWFRGARSMDLALSMLFRF